MSSREMCVLPLLSIIFVSCYGISFVAGSNHNSSNGVETFPNGPLSQLIAPQAGQTPNHFIFIDKLLENYDKRAWPTYGTDSSTVVTVNIYINSLGSISAANMEFSMDIYLRQLWSDPRLRFQQFGVNDPVTLNGQDLMDRIWKPDLFFRNLKSGDFHSITVPNKLIKLSPNGNILFSQRLTLRLSCHMVFHLYPLDVQRCWIILGSYAQTTDQVLVKWKDESPITIEKEIEIPEFDVTIQEPGVFYRHIDTGSFSFLNVSIVLLRHNGYHLVQTYLPTFLIVLMSFVSFWVPVEAAPARVALVVTTLLSLMTVAAGIRTQVPAVSYTKAMDVWIGVCSVLVFAALLEFATASYVLRKKIKPGDRKSTWIAMKKRNEAEEQTRQQAENFAIDDQEIQKRRSKTFDKMSRVLFPFAFLVFNLCYWIYYLSQRSNEYQEFS